MDNTESLGLVESALVEVETELGRLDQFTELAITSRATIEKLTSDIDALQADKSGLEQKTRASRFTNAKTMLELEQGDLAAFDRGVDRQSDRVVQIAQRATSLLAQVWSALLASRKASVEASLRATFDFRQIHTPATEFSSAAFSVIEVEEIRDTLFQHRWLPAERGLAIHDARQLRTRSTALLTMANELSELSIVDVELAPVVRPRQATTSNQSGTLNVLAAA